MIVSDTSNRDLDMFKCYICSRSCDTQGELNRHQKRHTKALQCEICHKGFPYRTELNRHVLSKHRVGNHRHHCPVDLCGSTFERKDNLAKHVRKYHASNVQHSGSNSSMANTAKTVSLSQDVKVPSSTKNLYGIYSISMFMQAASSGDIPTLELLMNTGFTTETRADDGSTAIHCAARSGQAIMVRKLIEKGAVIETRNQGNRLPLYEGFLSNDLDTVKALVEHMEDDWYPLKRDETERWLAHTKNINIFELYCARHPNSWCQVHMANRMFGYAMLAKNDTLAAALLNHPEFDVNRTNKKYAPIHDAARYGSVYIMGLLLASDQIYEGRKTWTKGRNALHIAASYGRVDVVEQLLHLNFDIECWDDLGRTPLQLAAMHGRSRIIKLLVDKWGANLFSRDKNNETPLHNAAFNGHWESVHVMLECIASRSHSDTTGIQLENMEFSMKGVITRLLDHPDFGNPNISGTGSKRVLLHCAVEKGKLEGIAELLSHENINVNAEDGWGRSPLRWAILKNRVEVARLLLQHPQIDVERSHGSVQTAYKDARVHGRHEIAKLILSYRAAKDQQRYTTAVITEDFGWFTSAQTGLLHDIPLQPEDEMDPEFDVDTSVDSHPLFCDSSDVEDEMMEFPDLDIE